MTDNDLKMFVDIVSNYFAKVVDEAPLLDEPVIEFTPPKLLDYSGFIQISGSDDGCVYITMPRDFAVSFLRRTGEMASDDALLSDFVGEMASTIASNARERFGGQFKISVPRTLVGGQQPPFSVPGTRFVLPIRWDGRTAHLGIGVFSSVEAVKAS
ncbi:MAG: chemotaxis protein CheX [Candidatus Eremiobacteraeota bacterium]|nr:chemotaxis protein CheX [Candidatus Eremiobacteraeota bacterium]MBV8364888.1 chemotaxis protein CheX [Candidatus Eremiobacteraeota bacterium]